MLRHIYIGLLALHPPLFREQFAEEMVDIFDQTTGVRARSTVVLDGLLSLVRQWALRPEFHHRLAPAPETSAAVPSFRSLEPYKPPPATMLHGGFLTLLLLLALVSAIGHNGPARRLLIGVHHASPHLLPVERGSIAERDLTTTVTFGEPPEDPLHAIAAVYFKLVRPLAALDADGDLVISSWELFTAPAALRRLDADHDGKLTADECGFSPGTDAVVANRARQEFMHGNPVLAALDANQDGEISATEIADSPATLKQLDRTGEGRLTPVEILPSRNAARAGILMIRLDTNSDGRISSTELAGEAADPFRELLRSADRNHDDTITRRELLFELEFRTEMNRQSEAARHAAGLQ